MPPSSFVNPESSHCVSAHLKLFAVASLNSTPWNHRPELQLHEALEPKPCLSPKPSLQALTSSTFAVASLNAAPRNQRPEQQLQLNEPAAVGECPGELPGGCGDGGYSSGDGRRRGEPAGGSLVGATVDARQQPKDDQVLKSRATSI